MEGRDTAKIFSEFKGNLNIDNIDDDNKSTNSEPKTKLVTYKKEFTDSINEKKKNIQILSYTNHII